MVSAVMDSPPMADTLHSGDDSLGTTTTRVAVDLMDLARIVCAHAKGRNGRALKLTDYLDSILRPVITRDHAATMKRVADDQRRPKKTPPPSA